MFELNVPGNYTVQNVQENEFINDKNSEADKAKYGLTYWVKFSGNAETYLWATKTEPVEGKEYYGHFQTTSGKSLRFKTDEKKDIGGNVITPESSDTQDNIARSVALKAAVDAASGEPVDVDKVLEIANGFLTWLQNTGSQSSSPAVPTPSGTKETQEEKTQPARDYVSEEEIPPEFR